MRRAPTPAARRCVEATKCVLVGAVAFLAVTSATSATADPAAGPSSTLDEVTAAQELSSLRADGLQLTELSARHDCSTSGFGADVIPGSALVLESDEVRHVSFDDGWAIYTGERAGTLLAVCRAIV